MYCSVGCGRGEVIHMQERISYPGNKDMQRTGASTTLAFLRDTPVNDLFITTWQNTSSVVTLSIPNLAMVSHLYTAVLFLTGYSVLHRPVRRLTTNREREGVSQAAI